MERHHKSGEKEISFPDGTRKTILTCGREMSEFSDGVIVVEYPEVRARNLLATAAVEMVHRHYFYVECLTFEWGSLYGGVYIS